jgi:methylthioribose-1-phosphate isomerase
MSAGRPQHIHWSGEALVLLDQRRLPQQEDFITCRCLDDVALAIRELAVRGAPAIGVSAAFGIVLGLRHVVSAGDDIFAADVYDEMEQRLAATRPTAVNLFWALARMRRKWAAAAGVSSEAMQLVAVLEAEAFAIYNEDIATNRAIGRYGAEVVPAGARILTHCNAGALACADYGTALGVVRAAHVQGKVSMVFADETRPVLQGARLTAWELQRDGIPVTVITDNMAAAIMASGLVDLVVVGADRIAANGDTANKIGTLGLALLARAYDIPFYVAAPRSTIDFTLTHGGDIPIEERNGDEVAVCGGMRVVPAGVAVKNPAFDVTPAGLITAIITERGIVPPVELERLAPEIREA